MPGGDEHRNDLIVKYALLLPLLACASPACFGWSSAGHEIICEIAFQSVDPTTRSVIKRLARSDPDPRYRTLRRGCAWPDHVREEFPERDADHYVNVPRNWSRLRAAECPLAGRCLFSALAFDRVRVADPILPMRVRWRALKFYGHWLGDLHQPLHVAYQDDRGGNEIVVTGEPTCRASLHAYWDDCLINRAMAKAGSASSKEYAAFLLARHARNGNAIDTAGEALDWANESYQLARRPDLGYCRRQGEFCRYSAGQLSFRIGGDKASPVRRTVHAGADYQRRFLPVVEQRLLASGLRLAKELDRLFTK